MSDGNSTGAEIAMCSACTDRVYKGAGARIMGEDRQGRLVCLHLAAPPTAWRGTDMPVNVVEHILDAIAGCPSREPRSFARELLGHAAATALLAGISQERFVQLARDVFEATARADRQNDP